jgi:hypothetical protein
MKDGVLLALSLGGKRHDTRVYVISDGGFGDLPEVQSNAEVRYLKVGEGNDNAAILAFEASRPPGQEFHQLFLRMQNYSEEAKAGELAFYQGDRLLDVHRIELKAQENRIVTFEINLPANELVRAELQVEDVLASDNQAFAFPDAAGGRSVLLVTKGNLFLEQALTVQPDVSVYRTASLGAEEAVEAYSKYDVVIFDGVAAPSIPPQGGVLFVNTPAADSTAGFGEALSRPTIARWERDHPVMRYVDFANVAIESAQALVPVTGAEPLAWVGEAPVVVALDRPQQRQVVLGWDFLNTDMPLHISFPVLLSNLTEWLSGARPGVQQSVVRPGDPLRFQFQGEQTVAQVRLPGRATEKVDFVDGLGTFGGTFTVGEYAVEAGKRRWQWAVDMRDSQESDLTPREEIKVGSAQISGAQGPPRVESHLWPYLVLLALLVLLGEWHLYHRRY